MERLLRLKASIAVVIITICCLNCTEPVSTNHKQTKNKGLTNALDTVSTSKKFHNVVEVYQDTTVRWTDEGSFDWLYFGKGKVLFDFNPSCGYWFPATVKDDKIVFFWSRNMNCNFNRGLDTAFVGVSSPVIGKEFGEINLVNDSVIKITYRYNEWVKRVNADEFATIDTLFPTIFRPIRF